LGIEHPKDIMIGDDQQIGRGAPSGVFVGEQARVNVSVGADDRKFNGSSIQFPGDAPLGRIRAKVSVWIQGRRRSCHLSTSID
jgi:hypothetical protein